MQYALQQQCNFDSCQSNYLNSQITSPIFLSDDLIHMGAGGFSQYIIEIYDNIEKMEIIILFTQKFTRCYGYKLNRINNIKYKICYIRRPSKLVKTNSHDYLKTLFNNPTISTKKGNSL